jgi:hypothetical protein
MLNGRPSVSGPAAGAKNELSALTGGWHRFGSKITAPPEGG